MRIYLIQEGRLFSVVTLSALTSDAIVGNKYLENSSFETGHNGLYPYICFTHHCLLDSDGFHLLHHVFFSHLVDNYGNSGINSYTSPDTHYTSVYCVRLSFISFISSFISSVMILSASAFRLRVRIPFLFLFK